VYIKCVLYGALVLFIVLWRHRNHWCIYYYYPVWEYVMHAFVFHTQNLKCLTSPITYVWLGQRMIGARHDWGKIKKPGYVILTRIWCNLPASKIWRLYISRYHWGRQNLKSSRDPDHAPLKGDFMFMLGLDIAYMHAKFEHSCFSRSAGMVGAHQNLNGSRDLTTPLSLPTTKILKLIQNIENGVF